MPQKIHAIYVLSPQISYDTKEQARTFDTLVLFVPYNEPYLDLLQPSDYASQLTDLRLSASTSTMSLM